MNSQIGYEDLEIPNSQPLSKDFCDELSIPIPKQMEEAENYFFDLNVPKFAQLDIEVPLAEWRQFSSRINIRVILSMALENIGLFGRMTKFVDCNVLGVRFMEARFLAKGEHTANAKLGNSNSATKKRMIMPKDATREHIFIKIKSGESSFLFHNWQEVGPSCKLVH
ncbi:hypothetical protein ACH5RR_013001 [Cinchona calisaya]|uniref:Uncharacterized protein n=1 Tax=Cinchona calisaya TaxID=153742 RepID=A0ABD3A030_9GENT